MNIIKHSNKVYAKFLGEEKGWGVFAAEGFKEGDVIENCPVSAPYDSMHPPVQEVENNLYWWFTKDTKKKTQKVVRVIVYGFGTVYNHSDDPNSDTKQIRAERIQQHFALRDIEKDEEITIDYGVGEWWKKEESCGIGLFAKMYKE